MKVCPLASGSTGNAYLVSQGATHILIDAGISARRLTQGLAFAGCQPQDLAGIIITHGHHDHVNGLRVFTKQYNRPLFATPPAVEEILAKPPQLAPNFVPLTATVNLPELTVEFFPVPHDSPGTVGFAVSSQWEKMALATDLGYVTQAVWEGVQGSQLLVVETNHHPEWVESGPYPDYLKQRVLGEFGHLSNQAGAELAANAVHAGCTTLILAHLSQENNTPLCARETVESYLSGRNLRGYTLDLAPTDGPDRIYTITREGAKRC